MRRGRERDEGGVLFRLVVVLVILSVALAGGLSWYRHHASSIAVSNAISSCSLSLAVANPYDNGALRYVAVGTGTTSAVAVVRRPSGWLSCVVGDGVSASPIEPGLLRSALSVVVVAADGSPPGALLILVHRAGATSRVVARATGNHSTVVAAADGFEVLRLTLSPWPLRRLGSPVVARVEGVVTGYSSTGRPTVRRPLDWCVGATVLRTGQGCSTGATR